MREVYSGESIKLLMHLTSANWWTYDCLNLNQIMNLGGNMVSPLRYREIFICTGNRL